MTRPIVRQTVELDRIQAIARRRLDPAVADGHAARLTSVFALPGSGARLLRWQGQTLAELLEVGGCFACLPVGEGKTLPTFLAPLALGSKRPILIMSAGLHDKTYFEFEQLARQWRSPNTPARLISREALALDVNLGLLDEINPDLIMIEECDDFSNPESAAAKRIGRFVASHPGVIVLALTGSPTRKSIMNWWHILCWCLGDGAPTPLIQSEAEMWAGALDHRKSNPVLPGALGATRKIARRWYFERVSQTAGVIMIDGDSCTQPLTVRYRFAREAPEMNAAFKHFGMYDETPAGEQVSDPLSKWRLDGQLGCGLFGQWDPPPPAEWRAANRAKAGFVRARIEQTARSRRPLDTEKAVVKAHPDHPVIREWQRIGPTFKGETETVWFSRATIDSVIDWLAELGGEPGIIWCGSVDFARALALETGLSYYGREGKADGGGALYCAPVGRSLIASWQANKKGFNLQAWPRQLWVMPPQSAKWLEQGFGRSHRRGALQPVIVDVLMTSGGTIDAFEAAVAEAHFAKETVGMTQKILRATIQRSRPRVTPENRFRWARKGDLRDEESRRSDRGRAFQGLKLPRGRGGPGGSADRVGADPVVRPSQVGGRPRLRDSRASRDRLLRAQGRLGEAAVRSPAT